MTHIEFKNDFQTPIPVAKYMVSLLPPGVKTVLEPTAGLGNIKNEIIKAGYDVIAPDNYFLLDADVQFDAVVANPPFSKKFTNLDGAPPETHLPGMRMGYWFLTDFIKRCDTVVALMPWFTISDSDVRLRALYRHGIKSITALPRKTFEFARIQTMVIHLERGYTGPTIFLAYDCLSDDTQNKLEL